MFWKKAAVLLACGLCLCGCAKEDLKQIDVLFTADSEGFYWSRPEPRLQNREAGGYAVLKNFLQKQEGKYLLFDGGSWFGTAPEGALTKGAYVAELAGSLPFTVATVTDKDFIYGWPSLRGIVRELPYPFVVSNLKLDNQIPWPLHDYQIRTIDGIKIAVFGLINEKAINRNRSRLPGLRAHDALKSAQEMTSMLKEKGVDYIILLSSLGDPDASGVGDNTIAEEVEGIDLILSSNKSREKPETEQINKTLVVYPGSKLDSIARVRLHFDKNNRLHSSEFEDIPLLKETYGEDENLAALAGERLAATRQKMNARLSETEKDIVHGLAQESELGNLLADCLHRWAKLDGAIINSDSIRSSLPAGRLTEYDLYKAYPYGDNITFLTIKGRAFTQALEASLQAEDNFPQIAGFTVQYSAKDKKIKRITLNNGRIIRPDETYRFAVTDHILAGGFGHDEFIDSLEFKSTFVEARQIMRTCLIRQKKVQVPSLGRWKK